MKYKIKVQVIPIIQHSAGRLAGSQSGFEVRELCNFVEVLFKEPLLRDNGPVRELCNFVEVLFFLNFRNDTADVRELCNFVEVLFHHGAEEKPGTVRINSNWSMCANIP